MSADPTPIGQPQASVAQAKLQAWLELKDRMLELHAELEFIRLMLRLRLPQE